MKHNRLFSVTVAFSLAMFSSTAMAKKEQPVAIVASSPALPADLSLLSIEIGAETNINIGSVSGGGGAGKATFKELTITKYPDTSTTQLFEYLVTGQHMDSLEITQGNKTWNLTLVMIQDYTWNGEAGEDAVSTEQWVLQFGAMQLVVDDASFCWSRILNEDC